MRGSWNVRTEKRTRKRENIWMNINFLLPDFSNLCLKVETNIVTLD